MICEPFYKSIGLSAPKPLERNDRVKFNRYVFQNLFIPRMAACKNKNTLLELSSQDLKFLTNFAERKVKAKTKEWRGFDDKNRSKREMTGACIEYGVLKLFGKEKEFDDSIVDASYKRNHPDLLPLGIVCDVKGSSVNNVPLVFKQCRTYICNFDKYKGKRYRCSNIIGITDQKSVWLLGIASPRVLEEYVDDNLIMMAENTTKTGFYGVDQLEDIPLNWDEFKKVCSVKSLVL
jgi:hypothetical protein